MSREIMEVPLTPVDSNASSSRLSEQYAMAPAATFSTRYDSSALELPLVDMYDSGKDKTEQTKELGPKLIPNAKPNSETAPDRPRDSETAPDRPRDSETAPDRPRDSETAPDRPSDEINTRVTLGSDGTIRRTLRELGETPLEGNSREMGSQVMKNLEKYRQWLKAHPPNIKLFEI